MRGIYLTHLKECPIHVGAGRVMMMITEATITQWGLLGNQQILEGKINPQVHQSLLKSSVYILWISKRRTSVSYQMGGSTLLKKKKSNAVKRSERGEHCLLLMRGLCSRLTVNRRHPTCRCGTTWRCLRWPDTSWWGWGEELAAGPLMCRAGGISGSLIHPSNPCKRIKTWHEGVFFKYVFHFFLKKRTEMCTYLSMQIFSTWGTSTWRSRMMVCSGSLHFQERT